MSGAPFLVPVARARDASDVEGGWSEAELSALADALAVSPTVPALAARCAERLSTRLAFDRLGLSVRASPAPARVVCCARPWGEPSWTELSDRDSPLERARRADEAVSLRRAATEAGPFPAPWGAGELPGPQEELERFEHALCVPLRGPEGAWGALGIFSATPFSPGDLDRLRVVALLVANSARRILVLEELERSEAERRRLEKLKLELAQLLVHDLKNPLTVLDSGLEYLERVATPLEGRPREMLAQLRVASSNLGSMVVNLLDIARMEEGRMSLARAPVRLEIWLREQVVHHGPAAGLAQIELSSECVPPGLTGSFDPLLVGRVVDNLLINGLRYTPRGGKLAVRATRRGDGALEISVTDTGPGIPPEHRERLFTKYGQLGGERDLHRTSRGLGLYFCKLVVELHGGEISVSSAPEGGALFRFVLPA